MADTPYLLAANPAATVNSGVNVMAVSANSEAEAEAMAAAEFVGDSNLRWTAPTATSLSSAPNNWGGFVVRVLLTKAEEDDIDVSYTGTDTQSFANLMTGIVAALNATDDIAGAAFDTDTLTISDDTDALGDYTAQFFLTAPNGAPLADLYVDEITHEGSSGDDLAVALVASGTLSRTVSPTVVGVYS